ncbi:MAG: DUF6101 family protein [Hyphomicrobiaceae bacterium]|nr:DUF6101 family protein [Hyphomicrobiaceae bacterium]
MSPLDLDPKRLPVRYSLPVENGPEHARTARDLVEIRPGSVAVQHEISGVPAVSRDLALEDFSGVAIRIEALDDAFGSFAVSVNLHHPDPKLCFPLHVSREMGDVGARWQSWARALNLPLLLPDLDGSWREPTARFGKLSVNRPHQRPARLGLTSRRSAISSIRESGDPELVRTVNGKEIIART